MRIKIVKRGGPEHYKNAFDDTRREGMLALGEKWVDKMLPLHFLPGAEAAYKYAPRSAKYLQRKAKQGKPALVFTGRLRDTVRSNNQVTATKAAAKVRLSTPHARRSNYAYVPPFQIPGQPFLADEIKTVSEGESKELAVIMQKMIGRALSEPTPVSVTE